MPLGDEKHGLIYEALANVLGSDYVSDDPAVNNGKKGGVHRAAWEHRGCAGNNQTGQPL
jgi:hypothetical protein